MRVVVLFLAVGMTVLADTASWITEVGGSFEKDKAGKIIAVDSLTSTWITDDDLAKLAALPELRRIDLSDTKVGDLGIAELRPLKRVTHFNCNYCAYLTDGAIAYIKHWSNLEQLNVRGSEVTSRVFEHLAAMKHLKSLDVGFSRVNDDGFDALSSLEELEDLHIGGDKMRAGSRCLSSALCAQASGREWLATDRLGALGPHVDRCQRGIDRGFDPTRNPEYGRSDC